MGSGLIGWLSFERGGSFPSAGDARDVLRAPGAEVALTAERATSHASPDGRDLLVVLGTPRSASGAPLGANAVAALPAALRSGEREPLAGVRGAFGLVWLDLEARRVHLVVDRVGITSLAYASDTRGVVFGTDAREVARIAGKRRLSAQSLYDYCFFHVVPAPTTPFAAVRRVGIAECVSLDASGTRTRQYWRPRFEANGATPAELAGELKSVLARAVTDAADRAPVGAFLSGGIDSSTVAGYLHAARGRDAPAFSIGFDAPGYDEMDYARGSARHFGLAHHEYYVTPADVATLVPRIAATYDAPFGNSSAIPVHYCARVAREHGMRMLLAGDGGDELFGGNERYAKQLVFERYKRLPRLLRENVVEPTLGAPSLWERVPLARKVQSYVRQARVPLPDRLHTYNYLFRTPPAEIFEPGFLERVAPQAPLELLRSRYGEDVGGDAVDRMCYLDWKITLADSDLPKVNEMTRLAGIDVAYPFLDDRVVELSTRVPGDWKVRGSRLRHFFKDAMADFLPPATIAKTKHGFGLPFGLWMREDARLRQIVGDAMASLRTRGLFRAPYLDALQRQHREEHAAYYGEFLWVLMVLELWLQQNTASAGALDIE